MIIFRFLLRVQDGGHCEPPRGHDRAHQHGVKERGTVNAFHNCTDESVGILVKPKGGDEVANMVDGGSVPGGNHQLRG